MKIVVQNFKTGKLSVADAPDPRVHRNGILVRTTASLISAGTDRAVIHLAKKTYLGKALDRPDLARKVINKARTDGLWSTYKVVRNLIAEPIPLGYSLVGRVEAVAPGIGEVSIGDRVACAGLGHANHAELVAVPRNLFVRVTDGVADEEAAYVTLGAIAMHGIRQADQQLGATVLVVGLGLLGQISAQLCHAAGYRVVGLDIDESKLALARQHGALLAMHPEDANLAPAVATLTRGIGVDAVLLTVGARDSGALFEEVAKLCRDRARVIVVGDVKMEISRRTYFEKELEILQSRSYGPGRYDPAYEEKGNDYPVGYVRWTERRNMQAFLDLLAEDRIDIAALTTHRFPIERAAEAYDLVTGKSSDFTVGILLTYDGSSVAREVGAPTTKRAITEKVGLGIIGAGQFAKGILLPAMFATGGFSLVSVASARGLSAKSIKDRYAGELATTDAERILDDKRVEAVIIATRHDSHARYVLEALRRGKHVFVEKPLTIDEADLDAIEEVAQRSAGILTIGFNRRFSPLLAKLAEHFRGRAEPMAMIYRVNAGRIATSGEAAWVHDPMVGGGRLVGEGCHFVDAMQYVSGARPVEAHIAAVNPRRRDLASDDVLTLTITFDDRSVGTLHYFANGDGAYPKERLEAFCQERTGVLDNFRSLELVAGGNTTRKRSMSTKKGYAEEAAAFLAACRTGAAPIPLASLLDTSRLTLRAAAALRAAAMDDDRAAAE